MLNSVDIKENLFKNDQKYIDIFYLSVTMRLTIIGQQIERYKQINLTQIHTFTCIDAINKPKEDSAFSIYN